MTELAWLTMDSAPKDGTQILAMCECNDGTHYADVIYWDAKYEEWEDGDESNAKMSGPLPARWMPIPPYRK